MKKILDKYSYFWLASLVVQLFLILLFVYWEEIQVHELLKIEFSQNLEVFTGLIQGQEKNLKSNTTFDFVFILSYTLFFLLSLKVIELSLQTSLKSSIFVVCLLPGVLDALENYALLKLIDTPTQSYFELLYWTTRLKWAIVIPFILMGLSIVIYYLLAVARRFLNTFFAREQTT